MMWFRFLILILAVVAVSSCARKFSPAIQENTRETKQEHETVTYTPRDTTIVINVQEVKISDSIPCPEVKYSREEKSNRANLSVNITDGKLEVNCKTDSLVERIKWLEAERKKETTRTVETVKTITLPPKRFIPKWVWWLLGINLLYIGARVLIWKYKMPVKL